MNKLFLLLFIASKIIFAQDSLSLSQAIEQALKNSDSLNIAKEKINQSYADKMLSQSFLWPKLSMKSFIGSDLNKDFMKNAHLTMGGNLEYSLINPSLWLKAMQNNQLFHKEQKSFDLALDLFVKEVAESYLEALSYQTNFSSLLEQIEQLEKTLITAKAKKEVGLIKPTDYMLVKYKLLDAQANKDREEALCQKSLAKLNLLLKENKSFKVDFPTIKEDILFEASLVSAKLESLKKELSASEYGLQANYWEYFPKINLEIGVGKKWPFNKPLESSIGLSLTMPIFGGFDRLSRIVWQKSEINIKKISYEQEINNVKNDITVYKQELELAKKSRENFKQALDLAKNILTTSKRLFEVSQIDSLELVMAHNNFLTANKAYLQACISIKKILINLLFITGKITKTGYIF